MATVPGVCGKEGFDKYGPAGFAGQQLVNALQLSGWSIGVNATAVSLVAGLSGVGAALLITGSNPNTCGLGTSSATVSFGVRFASTLAGGAGWGFQSGATNGWSVWIDVTGHIIVGKAGINGTITATSSVTVSANATNFLEATFVHNTGSSASYTVYLNGIQILTGSGLTTTPATVNTFVQAGAGNLSTDDLYVNDNTGSTNTSVLLTNPRIETDFPVSDNTVQFAFGAAVLGQTGAYVGNGTTTNAPGANELFLRKYTPAVAGTLNSVSIIPNATSAAAKFKAVCYSDSSGSPNTRLSTGTEVVGTTAGTVLTGNLVTPQTLVAGTPVWIGFITDTSVVLFESDANIQGSKAANTYASGAPTPAPAMTTGQASWTLWGNVTGVTTKWNQVSDNPALGGLSGGSLISYNSDSTVGHEDLLNFNALVAVPNSIYGMRVSAVMQDSDAGARTISLRTKSSGTDSGGSFTGQAPGTSMTRLFSDFDTDPGAAPGTAWTIVALNAAPSGYKIDS